MLARLIDPDITDVLEKTGKPITVRVLPSPVTVPDTLWTSMVASSASVIAPLRSADPPKTAP